MGCQVGKKRSLFRYVHYFISRGHGILLYGHNVSVDHDFWALFFVMPKFFCGTNSFVS